MRIGSLCSGIGGLELGLERALNGETLWQVEIEPPCRAVLAAHWPRTERFDDVHKVGSHNLQPVDIVCFGSPCQNISSAGDRTGINGAKSRLFYECTRIVAELCPRWVVVENVASGASRWVDAARRELERLGYATLPIPIGAADCGAPHRRNRIFIVANADSYREPARAQYAEVASASKATNALQQRRERPGTETLAGGARSSTDSWRSPQPDILRVVHGVPRGLDRARDRIAALGNSCTPQQAEVIGHVIRLLEQTEALH